MENNVQSNSRFKELDSLRGLAALMVLMFHFTIGRKESLLGFKLGITGVDLFFIISGFVIFMSLNKITNSKDFIINRVSRLYPTYWTAVTFTFILISIVSIFKTHNFENIEFIKYIGNMTMFQFYLGLQDLDGPYWTMIIEMLFYIGILLLFRFKLLKYLNFIGLFLSVFMVVIFFLWGNSNLVKRIIFFIPLLQFIPLFFSGIIFYKIYINKQKLLEKYLMIFICLVCQISSYSFAGRTHKFINHFDYSMMLIIYFLLFTLFVNHKLNFIVSKYTLFLGKISFALYLIHQYVSLEIIIPFLTNKMQINFPIAAIITLLIVILIASFITYFIEIPLGRIIKDKLRKTMNTNSNVIVGKHQEL